MFLPFFCFAGQRDEDFRVLVGPVAEGEGEMKGTLGYLVSFIFSEAAKPRLLHPPIGFQSCHVLSVNDV